MIVGNDEGVELFEITLSGPELAFTTSAVFAVCGAPAPVTVDNLTRPLWSRQVVKAGQTLKIGSIEENRGCRTYLAIKGGFPKVSVDNSLHKSPLLIYLRSPLACFALLTATPADSLSLFSSIRALQFGSKSTTVNLSYGGIQASLEISCLSGETLSHQKRV